MPKHSLVRTSLLGVLLLFIGCKDSSYTSDLASDDLATRIRAIEFLGSQRDRTAIPRLIGALSDPGTEVRAKAAWALGMMQAKEAVEPICLLLAESGARARQSAARALMQIEEPDALPSLREALDRETDRWVRPEIQEAINHLAQFEGELDLDEGNFRGQYH